MAETFHTQGVEIPLSVPGDIPLDPSAEQSTPPNNDEIANLSSSSPEPAPAKRISKSHAKKSRKQAGKQQSQSSKPPLRPAKDILSRIRHDPSLDENNFVVGYHDRHLPDVIDIDVSAWKGGGDSTDEEWIPQHRILYFRRKNEDGGKVWDRARRLDRIFGSGIPQVEGEDINNGPVDEGGGTSPAEVSAIK